MTYEWIARTATLAISQPMFEPPQLDEVLNALERDGWEIFSVLPDPAGGQGAFNRARVVARRPLKA